MKRAKVAISIVLSVVVLCSCFIVSYGYQDFSLPLYELVYKVEFNDGRTRYKTKTELSEYSVGVDGVVSISSVPEKRVYNHLKSSDDFYSKITYPCSYSSSLLTLDCTDFDISCRDSTIWVLNPYTQHVYQFSLMCNVVNNYVTPIYCLIKNQDNLYFGGSLNRFYNYPVDFMHFSNANAFRFYRSVVSSVDNSGYAYYGLNVVDYDLNHLGTFPVTSTNQKQFNVDLSLNPDVSDDYVSFSLDYYCGFHVTKENILAYYSRDVGSGVWDCSVSAENGYTRSKLGSPLYFSDNDSVLSTFNRSDYLRLNDFVFTFPTRTDYDLGNFDIYSYNWVRPVVMLPDGHSSYKFIDVTSAITALNGEKYPSVLYGQRCFYNHSGWGDNVLFDDGTFDSDTLTVASQVLRPVSIFNGENIVSLSFNRLGVYVDGTSGSFQLGLGIFYFDLNDGINALKSESIYTVQYGDLSPGWNDLSKVVHFRFDPPEGTSNFVLYWEVVSDVIYEFFPGNINISSYTDGQLIEISNAISEISNNQQTTYQILSAMPTNVAVSVVNSITDSVIYSMDQFQSDTGLPDPVIENQDAVDSVLSAEDDIKSVLAEAFNIDGVDLDIEGLKGNITDFSTVYQPAFIYIKSLFDRIVGDSGMGIMIVLLFTLTFGFGVFALGRRLH